MNDEQQKVSRRHERPGFQLRQRSGLRNPEIRLAWAEGMIARIDRSREYRGERGVGPLSIARTRYGDDIVEHLQFRSEPIPACGGGEFRFEVSHGNRSQHDIAIVDHLRRAEAKLLAEREETTRVVGQVREMAAELIARHEGDHAPATLVAIGCAFGIRSPMRLQIDLEVLGHGLTSGIDRVGRESLDELARALSHLLASHASRDRLRAALHREGARGWITATSKTVLERAGMSVDFALDHLDRCGRLSFTLGGGRKVRADLFWNEGTIECSFSDPGRGLDFAAGELTIHGQSLPETAQAALPGRRLDALLLHPCLPPDAIIQSVRCQKEYGGRIVVRLEQGGCPATV